MKIERVFQKGAKKTTLSLLIEKGQLETILFADGKEKRQSGEAGNHTFTEFFTKVVQKQMKAGFAPEPLKDVPAVADSLLKLKVLEIDLNDLLDAFPPVERAAIVADAIRKAKPKEVVGTDSGYQRADLFLKCPTPELLRHFLARLVDGSFEYVYKGTTQQNGDLTFLATAISNAARDPKNTEWIADEIEAALAKAEEPVLNGWLKARLAKFRSQKKVAKQLKSAPKKPGQSEDSLLRLIGEAPDDDAPRQVYGDWLLEQGNKWGEVVNLQCELARHEAKPRDPSWSDRFDELYDRINKLESTSHKHFIGSIKPFISEWDFKRGLLDRVTASAEKLLKPGAAEAVILRAPGAELELVGLKAAHAPKLAKLPQGNFRALKLSPVPPAPVLEKLLASPLVHGLVELELWKLNEAGALVLSALESPLRVLDVIQTEASEAVVLTVAKSGLAKTLQELTVVEGGVSRGAIESLSGVKQLFKLGIALSEPGCGGALAALTGLRELSVRTGGHWTAADGAALAKSAAPFEEIEIRDAKLQDVNPIFTRKLRSVDIRCSGSGLEFTGKGEAEAAKFLCPEFGDADAIALAASGFAKKLEFLSIRSATLRDKGVEALMKLTHLGTLDIRDATLSEKVETALAKFVAARK